jgi:hypothetical protein
MADCLNHAKLDLIIHLSHLQMHSTTASRTGSFTQHSSVACSFDSTDHDASESSANYKKHSTEQHITYIVTQMGHPAFLTRILIISDALTVLPS